jgi:hypothetical protein
MIPSVSGYGQYVDAQAAQVTREKLLARLTSDDVRIMRRRDVMFVTVSAGQRVNGGAG